MYTQFNSSNLPSDFHKRVVNGGGGGYQISIPSPILGLFDNIIAVSVIVFIAVNMAFIREFIVQAQ